MRTPLSSLSFTAALGLLVLASACTDDSSDTGLADASMGMGADAGLDAGGADAATDAGTMGMGDAGATEADGGTTGTDGGTSSVRMEIRDFTFSPANLIVPPGGTVIVTNFDSAPHSVTSASAPNTFVRGDVAGVSFDTGPFMGEAMFTIPTTAPVGTVIPCYCTVHTSSMRNTCQVTIGAPQ